MDGPNSFGVHIVKPFQLCVYSTYFPQFFWFWQEIVFGVTYVLSVQYSCAVVSVFSCGRKANLVQIFLSNPIFFSYIGINFLLLCISFLLFMDLQPYSHDCFSNISRTLFDFRDNTHWVSLFQRNNSQIFRTGVSCFSVTLFYLTLLAILEKQLTNIPDRCFLFLYNTLLLYSLSPSSQTERQTESQIHWLRVGWRNLFSSCAILSVFCFGMKQVLVLHTPYVLRVPYSCGVVYWFFWFWQEIVFVVTYVLSVQYSCAVVSVFLLWPES